MHHSNSSSSRTRAARGTGARDGGPAQAVEHPRGSARRLDAGRERPAARTATRDRDSQDAAAGPRRPRARGVHFEIHWI